MWVLAFFAGLLSLIVANSFYTEYMDKLIPWNANETAKDVGNFHAFAVAAELYMRDHAVDTLYLPLNTTVVRWSNYTNGSGFTVKGLSHAKGLPPGLANVSIDPTWRIQIVGSSYVLCTGMSAGGVVKMANLPDSPMWNPDITWNQDNVTVMNGTSPVEMKTFDVDAASAAVCKCDPTVTSGASKCL